MDAQEAPGVVNGAIAVRPTRGGKHLDLRGRGHYVPRVGVVFERVIRVLQKEMIQELTSVSDANESLIASSPLAVITGFVTVVCGVVSGVSVALVMHRARVRVLMDQKRFVLLVAVVTGRGIRDHHHEMKMVNTCVNSVGVSLRRSLGWAAIVDFVSH